MDNIIKIKEEYIKLDSFLKFFAAAPTGGQANLMIQNRIVKVNGEVCLMGGKKRRPGDIVETGGKTYVCEQLQF